MKALKWAHIIILGLCFIALLIGLVWFIVIYDSLNGRRRSCCFCCGQV